MRDIIFKKVVIFSLYFLVFISLTAKAQEKVTLQTAINFTLEHNLTIKQAQVTELLAVEDFKQSKNNLLPSLSANPQASYNFGRSLNLSTYSYTNRSFLYLNTVASLSVTLYQGGQLKNQILQNKLLLDVDKTNTEKIKNDLVLNVVTNYLQILTNQDLVIAAKQQIDIANQSLDKSQISLKVGNQTLADLSLAKAQVSTANLNLTVAQNNLDISVLTLKQFMEMDPNIEITVEKPDINKLTDLKTVYDANEVIKTAFTINPNIRLAEAQQQTSEQAIKVAKGYYFPTISLFGNIGSNYSNLQKQQVIGTTQTLEPVGIVQGTNQAVLAPITQAIYGPYSSTNQFGNNFNQSVGINLQIPIFNRFLTHTLVRKAKLNYQNAEIILQIAKNNLSKIIIQAILDVQAAEKQYQSTLQTFESNRMALNVTKQRYNIGLVNSLDYNIAITNYNKSQNDMIEARYSVIFRSKVIDYYLGNTILL